MKKLLGLLAAFGMVATTSATVVACGDKEEAKTELTAVKDQEVKTGESTIEKAVELVQTANDAKKDLISSTAPTVDKETKVGDVKYVVELHKKAATTKDGEATEVVKNTFDVFKYTAAEKVAEKPATEKAEETKVELEFIKGDKALFTFTLTEKAKEEEQKPEEAKTPNLDSLKAYVETVKNTDLTNKTDETKSAFEKALSEANAAIDAGKELTDKTLEEALEAAVKGLKDKEPAPSEPETPEGQEA